MLPQTPAPLPANLPFGEGAGNMGAARLALYFVFQTAPRKGW
jgi:hypothetical protein